MRGLKHPATAEVVENLLVCHEDVFLSVGDPARWSVRPARTDDVVEEEARYTLAQLADAIGTTADVVLRVLRLWSENEDTPAAQRSGVLFASLARANTDN